MAERDYSLDHPLRVELNNEVHARPPERLEAPCAVSCIARLADPNQPQREHALLAELLAYYDLPPPDPAAKHFAVDTGRFSLRWERHTEFSRYSVSVDNPEAEPFAAPPVRLLPAQWLKQLDGSMVAAMHSHVVREHDPEFSLRSTSEHYFDGNVLLGSQIAGGAAIALTDLYIHADGFSRILVMNDAMPPLQTGRMVQRLLEIETYRIMALLALPVAQALMPGLNDREQELADITAELVSSAGDDAQQLLDRLLQLGAKFESLRLSSHYRFAAAEAYHGLVLQRIAELREVRISGVQTFEEFTNRRLTPAINTCRATSARLHSLSDRMAHTTQLLSTRVDVDRKRQQELLLYSMDQRAKMQLRLQATVEGLSTAAITYYMVGLVYYCLRGLKDMGLPVNPSVWTAVSVPFVATLIFLAVRRVRNRLSHEDEI